MTRPFSWRLAMLLAGMIVGIAELVAKAEVEPTRNASLFPQERVLNLPFEGDAITTYQEHGGAGLRSSTAHYSRDAQGRVRVDIIEPVVVTFVDPDPGDPWVFRLDATERLSRPLPRSIVEQLFSSSTITMPLETSRFQVLPLEKATVLEYDFSTELQLATHVRAEYGAHSIEFNLTNVRPLIESREMFTVPDSYIVAPIELDGSWLSISYWHHRDEAKSVGGGK